MDFVAICNSICEVLGINSQIVHFEVAFSRWHFHPSLLISNPLYYLNVASENFSAVALSSAFDKENEICSRGIHAHKVRTVNKKGELDDGKE